MKRDLALWVEIFTGPTVWFVSLETNFALAPWACIFETKLALHIVSLLAFGISAAAGVLAWRQWKLMGLEMSDQGGDTLALARGRVMALSGVLLSTMFCIVIIAQAIPNLILGACQ